jgi:hypothetical protein
MPGHSYKGAAVKPYATLGNTAPTLFNNGGGDVSWIWPNANPANWSAEVLSGGVWTQANLLPGTGRNDPVDFSPGDVASVIGQDAAGNNVTARSNALTVT